MTTRAQLLNNLSSNKWVIDASFTRLSARPLDNSSIFGSLNEASSYAQLSSAAYPGQHVTVVGTEQVDHYYIDLSGNLSALAPDPVSYVSSVISSITSDVSTDTNGLSVITRIQQIDGKNNISYRRLSADDVYGLSDVISDSHQVLRDIYSDISSLSENSTISEMLSSLLHIKNRLSAI